MFLKPHNYIFIIKIKFLIQKTLGLYKHLEFEGSQGTKLIAAILIPWVEFLHITDSSCLRKTMLMFSEDLYDSHGIYGITFEMHTIPL